ncbi:MAG: hypothetical protein Q9O74_02985 [Planctomycetota bacterium]|nr:hypothetical protein [Planctomycetota bacterium]
MSQHKKAVFLAIVVLSLGLGVAVLFTTGVLGQSPAEDVDAVRERLLGEGQAAYARLDVQPGSSLDSPEAVRALLARVDFSSDKRLDAQSRDELLDALSGFVYARFIQSDPETYLEWREQHGYTFRSEEDLRTVAGIEQVYRQALGEEPAADLTMSEMFTRVFSVAHAGTGSPWSLTAVASTGDGLCAAVGEMSLQDMSRAPLEGTLSADLWRGRVWGGVPSWFARGPSAIELLQTHESLLYADIGMIMEFQDGVRRPVVCTFIREPSSGRWRLEYLMAYNYALEQLCPLAF